MILHDTPYGHVPTVDIEIWNGRRSGLIALKFAFRKFAAFNSAMVGCSDAVNPVIAAPLFNAALFVLAKLFTAPCSCVM